MDLKKEILICDCYSVEHQLVFRYDNDDVHPEVYVSVHLINRGFFSRLKYGLMYIFGYQCRYGAFEEFIINPSDVKPLKKIVKYLKKQNKK